jgi:hypothetical protein
VLRTSLIILLVTLSGCADQSRGAALNQCRATNYLLPSETQSQATPDCMKARSFSSIAECAPAPDEQEWDTQVMTFAFDNPRCYRPVGATTWLATALSPM